MNKGRRNFLKTLFGITLSAAMSPIMGSGLKTSLKKIVILHTNDTHSQIEPLSSNHPKYAGMGGYAKRASLIREIRAEGNPVLLFDSGDFYQGTPYFNMYNGVVEISLMNSLEYTAVNIGNHEFDKGLDTLSANLGNAHFDVLSSNYEFHHQGMKRKVLPYKVYTFGKISIGVFSLGINPQGLIGKDNWADTEYLDPVEKAAEMAYHLKKELKCSYVVCLSHLGYRTEEGNIGDYDLAKQSKNIDCILGGHSHTLLTKPIEISNSDYKKVVITQNGSSGIQVSRLDCLFSPGGEFLFVENYTKKVFNKQV